MNSVNIELKDHVKWKCDRQIKVIETKIFTFFATFTKCMIAKLVTLLLAFSH